MRNGVRSLWHQPGRANDYNSLHDAEFRRECRMAGARQTVGLTPVVNWKRFNQALPF